MRGSRSKGGDGVEITALVAREPFGEFTVEPLSLDGPRADEVLVAVSAVGLCHSDLAARDGMPPFPLPGVFGHEGAGTVLEVGDEVRKVAPGDHVVLTFNSCGQCRSCTNGAPAYCHQFLPLNYAGARTDGSCALSSPQGPVGSNFFGQSSFASHALANERNVVKLPDDAPLQVMGPLGCGIQTGAGAVMNSMAAPAGSSLLVLGGGSVGLAGVLGAVVQGCSTIIVAEPHQQRRDLALRLGATHAIDPTVGDLGEQVRAIVGEGPGDGVEYVFDTTAIASVIEASFTVMAPHATFGLVGVPADPDAAISLGLMQAITSGIRVLGIVEGDSIPDEFIPRLATLHAQGQFRFDEMITTFPFTQINEAIAAQHNGEVVKVVLVHD